MGDAKLRPLARRARIAWTDAEAGVTLARSEPPHGGPDPNIAATTLGALRRVVYGVHELRLETDLAAGEEPMPELLPLADGLQNSLGLLADQLRDGDSAEPRRLPALRRPFREAIKHDRDGRAGPFQAALDELIDAIDTVADAIGVELP